MSAPGWPSTDTGRGVVGRDRSRPGRLADRGDPVDPPHAAVVDAVARAVAEDLLPLGDLSASLVPADATARFDVVSRGHGVVAGRACALEALRQIDPMLRADWEIGDGDIVSPGDVVARVCGPLRPLLTAERTVLNFLGHLSGVATITRRYVDCVAMANPPPGSSTPAIPRRVYAPWRKRRCGPEAVTTTGGAFPTPS